MHMHSKFVLAAILAGGTLMSYAEDAHHPADVPVDSAESTASVSTATTKTMDEQIQKMQAAHDKAATAATSVERQSALQEGMQVMKDSMAMMSKQQAAMDCMGMSGAKDGAGKGMMDMMMQMMEQQSSMMEMPMDK